MLGPSFPAKVLLLGEYTILNGSKALALPYKKFSGTWSFDKEETHDRKLSREGLHAFLQHDSAASIDYERLKSDVREGLWFDSSIPHGHGLGSSGSLIAAIFDKYARVKQDPLNDRQVLANLEDFFHGSSSGIDPLVSHIQKPLLIHSFKEVEIIENELNLKGFFLLNTGKPRQTGPLVSIYQEKMKDPQFKHGCAEVLSKDVNFAIEALLSGDRTHLFHHLWHISKFQWDFFPEMIPTQMRGVWNAGLESGDYILKLCGAGGGGFILGYSEKYNVNDMRMILNGHDLMEL